MPGADLSSLLVISAIPELLCACVFFALRRSFPGNIRGLHPWGVSCLLIAASACLVSLRDSVPFALSGLLPEVLSIAGAILMYASLRDFEGYRPAFGWLASMLAATGILLLWPVLLQDDYRLRTGVASGLGMALFLACATAIMKMRQKSFVELLTGASFAFAALLSFMRYMTALLRLDTGAAGNAAVFQAIYFPVFLVAMLSASIGFMLMASRRMQLHLERQVSRDELTGIYTRGAYFELISKEIARTRRSGEPLSLLMLDLDNFKQINDRYGHPVGDRVLVDFVQKVNRILRTQDIFGRYGGEEFSILLPDTPAADAYRVARRICQLLEKSSEPGVPDYTVSIGTATMLHPECLSLEAFIRQADQALYQAKNAGKNRVEMHDGEAFNFA